MVCAGVEADAPVAQYREEKDTYEEIWKGDDGVCEDVCAWAVQPIHAFADEHLAFFEEGGDTGH